MFKFSTFSFVFIAVLSIMVSFAAADADLLSSGGSSILQLPKTPGVSLKSMSLLDPNRFTMRNQYMMTFSSVNGAGGLVGTYLNTMEYRFNCPLVMKMKIAYQSQTGHLFGGSNSYSGLRNNEDGQLFVPSFDLIYKPFKNTTISFGYRDYRDPSLSYDSWRGYGRYGYSPYSRY